MHEKSVESGSQEPRARSQSIALTSRGANGSELEKSKLHSAELAVAKKSGVPTTIRYWLLATPFPPANFAVGFKDFAVPDDDSIKLPGGQGLYGSLKCRFILDGHAETPRHARMVPQTNPTNH